MNMTQEPKTYSSYTRFIGFIPIILGLIALVGLFTPFSILKVYTPSIPPFYWWQLVFYPLGNIDFQTTFFSSFLVGFVPSPPASMIIPIFGYIILTLIIAVLLAGLTQIIAKDSIASPIIILIASIILLTLTISLYFNIQDLYVTEYLRMKVITYFNYIVFTLKVDPNIVWFYAVDTVPPSPTYIGIFPYDVLLQDGAYMFLIPSIISIPISITSIILTKTIGRKERGTRKTAEPSKPIEQIREQKEPQSKPIEPPKEVSSLELVTIQKIEQIFRVSDRIKLEMMQKTLGLTEEAFLNNIYNWADEFNFKIDGDYLLINKDTMDQFIQSLRQRYT